MCDAMESKGTLIERVIRGEAGAIDRLYRQYYTVVRRMARRIDPNAPEDQVQIVLMKVLELLKDPDREFDGDFRNKFTGWLYRVAKNVLAEGRRRQGRHLSLDAGGPPESAQVRSPSQIAVQTELESLLRVQVNSLPSLYREVLESYFFDGRSTQQIAQRLGLDEVTVRKRMQRAYDRLRAQLKGVATTLYRAGKSR